MDRPEFEITITKSGRVKVHVKGVKGQRCIQMADLIREIVGTENQRELTSDYYERPLQVRINTRVQEGPL